MWGGTEEGSGGPRGVAAGLAGGPGAPLPGVRGAPGLGVWVAQRGVGSAALRVSAELVPMRGGAEGIWAGWWGASWDLGCRSWGRAAEAADGWSHVGAARHRGRDGCGSPSCHLESDRRSSQGSQFRRLTSPPPETAHRTLDPIGPLETRPDSPGEPGMQPRDPCLPWRGKLRLEFLR